MICMHLVALSVFFCALSVDEPTNSTSSFEIIDGLEQNDYKEQKMNGMSLLFLYTFITFR